MVIPYSQKEKGYGVSELIAVEVAIPALTYDGTATVNIIDNVNSTVTGGGTYSGNRCYQFYYQSCLITLR